MPEEMKKLTFCISNILCQLFSIDQQAEYGNLKFGPKGKIPWIEYNGTTLGDSQFIIEFLGREFNVDLNSHLSARERATAWAIQKWLEEFTYWYWNPTFLQ